MSRSEVEEKLKHYYHVINPVQETENVTKVLDLAVSEGLEKVSKRLKSHYGVGIDDVDFKKREIIFRRGILFGKGFKNFAHRFKDLIQVGNVAQLKFKGLKRAKAIVRIVAQELAVVPGNGKISSLTFDDCLDDEKDAEFLLPLAVVLKTNRYLKVLKLENCNLSDKDIAKLYEPLRKTTALESFSLMGNPIGSVGAEILFQALTSNKTLRTLNILDCGLKSDLMLSLQDFLKRNPVIEHIIGLGHILSTGTAAKHGLANEFDYEAFITFFPVMQRFQTFGLLLRTDEMSLICYGATMELGISFVMKYDECKKVADILFKQFSNFIWIVCDDFDALDMDMKKFAVFVQKNVKLRRLVLKKFDIHENKPDQVQLFRVLEANTTIEELVFQNCLFGIPVESMLADAIARNKYTALNSLYMKNCNCLSDDVAKFASKVVKSRSRLYKVDFDVLFEAPVGWEAMIARNRAVAGIKEAIEREEEVEYKRYKLMFIGDAEAGKTSTMRSLLGHEFNPVHHRTNLLYAKRQLELSLDVKQVLTWQESTASAAQATHQFFLHDFKSHIKKKQLFGKQGTRRLWLDDEVHVPAVLQSTATLRVKMSQVEELLGFDELPVSDVAQAVLKMQEAEKVDRVPKKTFDQVHKAAVADTCISLWDFGGQEVFCAIHHLFLSGMGVYLLAFDLKKFTGTQVLVSEEVEKLDFWLDSVALHAPKAPVLLIGTRAKELTEPALEEVNKLLKPLAQNYASLVLLNREKTLYFFPIDNSLNSPAERDLLLDPVKREIEKLVSGTYENAFNLSELRRSVKLSWMFFMDQLIRKKVLQLQYSRVLSEAEQLGFKEAELQRMLQFYKETGAIIYIPVVQEPEKPDLSRQASREPIAQKEQVENMVILNPQGLLDALSKLIYDTSVSKDFDVDHQYRKDIINYEKEGLLSVRLVRHLLKGFREREIKYLLKLCESNFILCQYCFGIDSEVYLVPSMIRQRQDVSTGLKDSIVLPSEKIVFYLHFDRNLLRGVFERLVCLFVSKSGNIEGSTAPSIRPGIVRISFRATDVFLVLEKTKKRVAVVVHEEYRKTLKYLMSFCRRQSNMLTSKTAGSHFHFTVLLKAERKQGADDGEFLASYREVRSKLKEVRTRLGADTSQRVKQFQGTEFRALEQFSHYFPTLVREQRSGEAILRAASTTINIQGKFDCFLAHEWGTEEDGFKNHQSVRRIKEELTAHSLKAWIDEEQLEDQLATGIMTGLDNSHKIVIFVTKRYMDRLDNPDHNCTKEFCNAVNKGMKNCVLVLFEEHPDVKDPQKWAQQLKYHFSGSMFLDMSTELLRKLNMENLVSRIKASIPDVTQGGAYPLVESRRTRRHSSQSSISTWKGAR